MLLLDLLDSQCKVLLRPCTAKWGSHERNADRLILGKNKAGVVLDIEDLAVAPLR